MIQCAANGCPIPATVRTESGKAVCSCHLHANPEGWPKATGVAVEHADLWNMARQAQCSSAPDACNSDLAKDLIDIARAAGLQLGDHREAYKRAGMRLRYAGMIVESAIRQLATDASLTAAPLAVGESRVSPLALMIAGVANNVRLGAPA